MHVEILLQGYSSWAGFGFHCSISIWVTSSLTKIFPFLCDSKLVKNFHLILSHWFWVSISFCFMDLSWHWTIRCACPMYDLSVQYDMAVQWYSLMSSCPPWKRCYFMIFFYELISISRKPSRGHSFNCFHRHPSTLLNKWPSSYSKINTNPPIFSMQKCRVALYISKSACIHNFLLD